jgi:hypothetical protein
MKQKILILTPLDETNVYTTATIYRMLSDTCDVFSVPMYADYLLQTGIAQTEEEAIIFALKSVSIFVDGKEKCPNDLIVIGNSTKDIKYDMIIAFNKEGTKLVAEHDARLEKIQEKCKAIKTVSDLVNNVYSEKDCESALIDSVLTSEFVLEYLSGVHNNGKPAEETKITKDHYGRA